LPFSETIARVNVLKQRNALAGFVEMQERFECRVNLISENSQSRERTKKSAGWIDGYIGIAEFK